MMRYSLGFVWSALLACCVLSLCDAPLVVSFDKPFIVSPCAHVIEQVMHVWSDIRDAAALHNESLHNQNDYMLFIHAIIGQLVCIDNALSASNFVIMPDDLMYLIRLLELVMQEALSISLNAEHKRIIEMLCKRLLRQADNASISSC